VKGNHKAPLSPAFQAIPSTLGPLDPERRKSMQKIGPEAIKAEHYKVMRVFGNHDCLWLEMHATENPALFVYKSKSWNQVLLGCGTGMSPLKRQLQQSRRNRLRRLRRVDHVRRAMC